MNIYAHRAMLLPTSNCTFNPQDQTLTATGTGDGTNDTIAYEYVDLGDPGDLIWLIPYADQRDASGPGVDPKGYDSRFSGLYVVEDHRDNTAERNWKLRRAPSLDSTEKYEAAAGSTVWILSDANNPKPSWSPLGSAFQIILPLFFQLNVSPGPILNTVTFVAPIIPM